MASIKIVL